MLPRCVECSRRSSTLARRPRWAYPHPIPCTRVYSAAITGEWDSDVLRLAYNSLTTPPSVIDYHIPSGRRMTRRVSHSMLNLGIGQRPRLRTPWRVQARGCGWGITAGTLALLGGTPVPSLLAC